MSSPVIDTDIPVMVNGRKAQLRNNNGLVAIFPRHPAVQIPLDNIAGCVHGTGRIGICLMQPMVLVPGTKKGVLSFILTWSRTTTDEDWAKAQDTCSKFGFCYDNRHVKCTHSMCNSTDVQLGHPVVVWTTRTCKVIKNVELAVLQRTKGGMSTFDIHLVPAQGKGAVECVEMLPHSMMDEWADLYPNAIIDAGPDPLHPSVLLHAQEFGKDALLQSIDEANENTSASDSASEWEMSDDENDCSSESGTISDASKFSESSGSSDSGNFSDSSDSNNSSGSSTFSVSTSSSE